MARQMTSTITPISIVCSTALRSIRTIPDCTFNIWKVKRVLDESHIGGTETAIDNHGSGRFKHRYLFPRRAGLGRGASIRSGPSFRTVWRRRCSHPTLTLVQGWEGMA